MKRILLLIPALNAGGAERVMVTLANEWSKTADVTLMVFNNGHCFYRLEDRVHIKPMNIMPKEKGFSRNISIPRTEIKRFTTIFKEIKKGHYDLVLSFCYTTNMIAAISSLFLKKEKIVISERNDPYGYYIWIRRVINVLYGKCDTVVCQNQMVKDYFKEQNFKNKLVILPNPVNFADIPTERPEYIKKEIVTVGRLINQKNQRILIEAFNEIKDEFPEYSLRIFGVGILENELKQLITDKALEKRVFLMGVQKRIMFEVNKSEVFVLPSNFEGFPNVLIEAMATGLPVISSDFKTGIARELITSDNNGNVFEVDNKDALIEALRNLLNRSNEFPVIGENNRKVASKYRDEVIAEKWFKIIGE